MTIDKRGFVLKASTSILEVVHMVSHRMGNHSKGVSFHHLNEHVFLETQSRVCHQGVQFVGVAVPNRQ